MTNRLLMSYPHLIDIFTICGNMLFMKLIQRYKEWSNARFRANVEKYKNVDTTGPDGEGGMIFVGIITLVVLVILFIFFPN